MCHRNCEGHTEMIRDLVKTLLKINVIIFITPGSLERYIARNRSRFDRLSQIWLFFPKSYITSVWASFWILYWCCWCNMSWYIVFYLWLKRSGNTKYFAHLYHSIQLSLFLLYFYESFRYLKKSSFLTNLWLLFIFLGSPCFLLSCYLNPYLKHVQ